MKVKAIPAIITLVAGLITCVISIINQVNLEDFLKRLCVVIVIFFILGSIIKSIIEHNFRPEQEDEESVLDEDEQQSEAEQEDAEEE